MNMEEQLLPIVPFGTKYKGQPITALLNDTSYLEWCKQQPWFKNYPIVYNICVNQTINNQNSKTPEHNKLQNLFLDELTQIKLLNILLGNDENFKQKFKLLILDDDFVNYIDSSTITLHSSFGSELIVDGIVPKLNRSLKTSKIIFEDKFNWDFILYHNDEQNIQFNTKCDVKNLTFEKVINLIIKKYNFKESEIGGDNKEVNVNMYIYSYNDSIICCELKPILGEDYPHVLRKMKNQMELTENYTKFKKKWKKYILIIGSFTSTCTSKRDLIKIFNQSNIKIIFTDELFETSKSVAIKSVNTNTEQLLPENKFITDNLLQTQQKLLQAEEKIKQLEEEILLLKTQKQSKTITDYFNK